MSTARPHDESEIRHLAEASAWRVRLTEAEAESSPAFEAWLADDPANRAAWAQVQAPWTAIGEAATSPELMAARATALARARRRGRRRWAGSGILTKSAAGLAAAVVAVTLAVAVSGVLPLGQTYRTGMGERRVLTLEDGSRVSLDSSTVVKVRYTRDARRLELLSGQARFDVAHNVQRPFSVKARDQMVVATGTAFNIDLMGQRVLVTLIQGHVTVLEDRPSGPPRGARSRGAALSAPRAISLDAGQQLVATPTAPPRIEVASLDRATAWESGQLVFEDETLAAVAARVSRYTDSPVTVDPDVASLRISGVFNAGDVATFVDTVQRYLPVSAREQSDGAIVLHRRG